MEKNFEDTLSSPDEKKYYKILESALSFIAQVVGGDVILYDQQGCRIKAFTSDGMPNDPVTGMVTDMCGKTMREGRPSMGASLLSPGSMAVRIPLTQNYGLAFNNKQTVLQRTRLLDKARNYQYARYHLYDIIGDSPKLTGVKELAREVAKSSSTVLIYGETGTGKELFAQAIHNLSSRASRPFVAINCGALPDNLVESSLFGYAEGAFTGAKKSGVPGVFEQADSGTLFLDEISEMAPDLQVKLLRVIQEREVRRIGDTKSIPVDVRIIASSNKALGQLVEKNQFRSDLYYRLNVVELEIPPLRERREDLPGLTYFFTEKFSIMTGKTVNDITPEALHILDKYHWPGNVRELQNCIEHAFNVIDDCSITPETLPHYIVGQIKKCHKSKGSSFYEQIAETERNILSDAMRDCNGNQTLAAQRLGINRTTLWRLLKQHGLH